MYQYSSREELIVLELNRPQRTHYALNVTLAYVGE